VFNLAEGFVAWGEVESVVRERRLLSWRLFPIPLIFDVGEGVLLTLRVWPFAVLRVYRLPGGAGAPGRIGGGWMPVWRGALGPACV